MNISVESFHNPPVRYRSLPFWAWNDLLDHAELVRQIQGLKAQGFGGFFMHSREGLETPYLSEQWNQCIQVCVETAKALGMEAWLYDEDRWPSGSCGGLVTAQEAGRHALKGLTLSVVHAIPKDIGQDASVRALYVARVDGDTMLSYRRLPLGKSFSLSGEEALLIVRFETSQGSVWFNGSPPPDNLSFDTVQAFIQSTHEPYYEHFRPYWGTVIPGIFTDEPSLADRHAKFSPERSWIPWSLGMEEYYQALGLGDIYEKLPLIFFNAEESFKVRHDYWLCISQRYESCYSKQIGNWCDSHEFAYTGHFLQEDKMGLSTRVNGSIMPHYTHQEIPGIDLLGEVINEYLTVKQVSSVAHQYGKQRVICETYAGCGWDFSFEGQKWIGDWQSVLGVTNRCQHLMLYSLRANRKRDYPQSFNYHSIWWEKQYLVENYFARISTVLQEGEVQRPILLIHPMSTVWGHIGCSPYGNPIRRNERDVPKGDAYGYALNRLLKLLEGSLVHTDLGDETLIARTGEVVGSEFKLNLAAYSVVVMPRLETLLQSTYNVLVEFVEQGGKLVILGPDPTMIEGSHTEALGDFFSRAEVIHASDNEHLVTILKELAPPILDISPSSPSIHVQIRKSGSMYYYFVVNTDREQGGTYTFRSQAIGALTQLDPLCGKQTDVSVASIPDIAMVWTVSLEGAGSLLYAIDTSKPALSMRENQHQLPSLQYSLVFSFPCAVALSHDNALVLDACRYSLDGEAWSEEAFTWQIQKRLRSHLSMVSLDTDEIEQRYRWASVPHPNDGHQLQLEYRFIVSSIEDCLCRLAIEEPHLYTIGLNGAEIPSVDTGYYIDRSFRTIQLPKLQLGENILTLNCRYTNAMSLEDVYLIGNFSVDIQRKLKKKVSKLDLGSWTDQGLFHYPGNVTYHQQFTIPYAGKKIIMTGWEFSGACMTISINGDEYDIPWKGSREIDISRSVRKGTNQLNITVFGSPRNLLGPLHMQEKPAITNPASFFPPQDQLSKDYQVVGTGLLKAPRLLVY